MILQLSSSEEPSAQASQIPAPITTGTKVAPSVALNYAALASFSWDQDSDKVKVNSLIICGDTCHHGLDVYI